MGDESTQGALAPLLTEVRACTLCVPHLPLGPRPILRARTTARILIVGQAPGTRVHASGVPWDDPSGARLRDWLQVTTDEFYDESRVALMPMGFCYPGKDKGGGDSPPRRECAPAWHARVLAALPDLKLRLLVGSHAQAYYLPGFSDSMTECVRRFREAPQGWMPLPHPSWRVGSWLKRNAWFTADVLPALREAVRAVL